ncbi:hypothetical protein BD779DRAFT_1594656 [Infundibulicybe gibba]|nr:hypothetical protein BD779DRAFT_1594656 [Infundibulicybe gibba]
MFAFRSPQSRAVLGLVAWFLSARDLDWTSSDKEFISCDPDGYTAAGLAWFDKKFKGSTEAVYQIFGCMHDIPNHALKIFGRSFLYSKPFDNVDHMDFKFWEYARMVLSAFHVENGVVRDIVTGEYLSYGLPDNRRRDYNVYIAERRIRALRATDLPVTTTLFRGIFTYLKRSQEMSQELRWQEAILLGTLLAQGRLSDPNPNGADITYIVALEVSDVCTHHEIFSDDDLKLFFDTVRTWMESEHHVEHRACVMKWAAKDISRELRSAASERDSVRRFAEFLGIQVDG